MLSWVLYNDNCGGIRGEIASFFINMGGMRQTRHTSTVSLDKIVIRSEPNGWEKSTYCPVPDRSTTDSRSLR